MANQLLAVWLTFISVCCLKAHLVRSSGAGDMQIK